MPYYRDSAQLPGLLRELQEVETAVANPYPIPALMPDMLLWLENYILSDTAPLSPRTKVMLCSSSSPTSPLLHHGFAQCIGTQAIYTSSRNTFLERT